MQGTAEAFTIRRFHRAMVDTHALSGRLNPSFCSAAVRRRRARTGPEQSPIAAPSLMGESPTQGAVGQCFLDPFGSAKCAP